jgi:hypothetical protein
MLGDFLAEHGTKVLGSVTAMVGTAQVGISSLVTGQVISPSAGILFQFILGVLAAGLGGVTIARGFSTGAVVQQAKQIVATNLAQNPLPPTEKSI